jgi:hypothetical protein
MRFNRDYNPFANQDLHIPKAYLEDVRRYSQTHDAGDPEKGSLEEVPFMRYVDIWTLAAAVGASEGAFVPLDADQKHRFYIGTVLHGDLQRIEFLMLLAIANTGDPFIVSEPRKVLDIVEAYVAGGLPIVFDMVREGHLSPMQNVTRSLLRHIKDRGAPDSTEMNETEQVVDGL